jgi:hypothetical protein
MVAIMVAAITAGAIMVAATTDHPHFVAPF